MQTLTSLGVSTGITPARPALIVATRRGYRPATTTTVRASRPPLGALERRDRPPARTRRRHRSASDNLAAILSMCRDLRARGITDDDLPADVRAALRDVAELVTGGHR